MNNQKNNLEQKFNTPIFIVSILIPIVVAVLYSVKLKDFGIIVEPFSFLPPIYATLNGLTAAFLVIALFAIKNKNRALHEKLMTTAIFCSVLFLIMYVVYHMTANDTKFGDLNHDGILSDIEKNSIGNIRYFYYFILITHIVLSIIVIPLVLTTYVRALSKQFENHKKIAKIAYPIWLYVAITGVIVYLMISPYYAS